MDRHKHLNLCIVGCGDIATYHARYLRGKTGLWFYNRTKENAISMNRKFHGSGVFNDFQDVLDNQQIDAVILCTPPELHCEQTIAALTHRKSVLVEKPMCISMEETANFLEAEQQTGDQFVMVAENYLYKPSLDRIKELIDGEGFGSLRKIHVKIGYRETTNGWRKNYGALLECGIHFISLITEIIGDTEPDEILAEFPNWTEGKAERTSTVRMIYPGGQTGELNFSWEKFSLPKGLLHVSRIDCENGKIYFESNGLFILTDLGGRKLITFPGIADLTGRKAMMEDFLACLSGTRNKPRSTPEKAARNLKIIFRAYQSQNIPIQITE